MNLGFAPTKENRAVHWRYSYAVLIFIAGFDMKRWSFVLLLAGSMPAAGALGFWFGVREGLQLGVWADAAPRGALALHSLTPSELENCRLNMACEFDVDHSLIWPHYLHTCPLYSYLDSIWGLPDYSQHMAT